MEIFINRKKGGELKAFEGEIPNLMGDSETMMFIFYVIAVIILCLLIVLIPIMPEMLSVVLFILCIVSSIMMFLYGYNYFYQHIKDDNKKKAVIKYGLIFGLVSVISGIISRYLYDKYGKIMKDKSIPSPGTDKWNAIYTEDWRKKNGHNYLIGVSVISIISLLLLLVFLFLLLLLVL